MRDPVLNEPKKAGAKVTLNGPEGHGRVMIRGDESDKEDFFIFRCDFENAVASFL